MGLILKTTLKNIFGKPLRSLLVIFSIFVCAFSALFCFDLSSSMKNLMVGLFSEVYGDTDLTAYMSVINENRQSGNLKWFGSLHLLKSWWPILKTAAESR